MRRWLWVLLIIVIPACACLLCLGGWRQPIRDQLDRRATLRHIDLPPGLRLVEYDGYPAMVGLGQREGLSLDTVLQLSAAQVLTLERSLDKDG